MHCAIQVIQNSQYLLVVANSKSILHKEDLVCFLTYKLGISELNSVGDVVMILPSTT